MSSVFKLVHHFVAGKRCMICLNVQFEMLSQTICAQEIQARSRIRIILVLCRLVWFRFEQQISCEANFFGVIRCHVQKSSKVIEFPFHVGIKKGLVSLAATPEDIVLAA